MDLGTDAIDAAAAGLRIGATAVLKTIIEQRIKSQKTDSKSVRTIDAQVKRALEGLDEVTFQMGLTETLGWATRLHLQGMGGPVDTLASSVALDFSTVPRRFQLSDGHVPTLGEQSIILSERDYLLLGDPGSGKTTTLKRLALDCVETARNRTTLPIIVICRQVDWENTTLARRLIAQFGIDFTNFGTLELSPNLVLQFVALMLDEMNCLLLVDGLDEIPDQDCRAAVLNDLERLRLLTKGGRIICSCRSGDAPHAAGFDTAELLPLAPEQIAAIVQARTGDSGSFLERVREAGISDDILDRPLFLGQLLAVYESSGELPRRPVDLYRQLLQLLLVEWDGQKRVGRRSAYANFNREAKREFLAEVAFRLTTGGYSVFSEASLLKIYKEIYIEYGLPANEGRQVVREIESHTGIIVEVSDGFQFTHYTMQEFLCADSISRRPLGREVTSYVKNHPAIVAVAVALSSQPTQWLTQCLELSPTGLNRSFVSRLGQEKPRFAPNFELAMALSRLMASADSTDAPYWEKLSQMPASRQAMALLPERFDIERDGSRVVLRRRTLKEQQSGSFLRLPGQIFDLFVEAP